MYERVVCSTMRWFLFALPAALFSVGAYPHAQRPPDTPETGHDVESSIVPGQGMHVTNPQVGARMLGPLRQWRRFAEPQRSRMEAVLKDLIERVKSRDIFEVLSKSLAP